MIMTGESLGPETDLWSRTRLGFVEERIKNQERTERIDINKKIIDILVMNILPWYRVFDLSNISGKLKQETGDTDFFIETNKEKNHISRIWKKKK